MWVEQPGQRQDKVGDRRQFRQEGQENRESRFTATGHVTGAKARDDPRTKASRAKRASQDPKGIVAGEGRIHKHRLATKQIGSERSRAGVSAR